MQGINVLVVVYNKKLSDCPVFDCLGQGINVCVADNSTRDMGNKVHAASAGYRYVDMGGNKGLSKAYNAMLNFLEKDDSLVCFFDDDTEVDPRYFEKLRTDAVSYPDIDVFVPVVKDEKGMLSPCMQKGLRGKRVGDLSELPEYGVSAINSGMAVRLSVFKNYRYDEDLFLDYIDHAFMRDIARQQRSKICIMDVILRQHFSGSEKQDKTSAVKRMETFKKDAVVYANKYGISLWRVRLFVFIRKVKALPKYI